MLETQLKLKPTVPLLHAIKPATSPTLHTRVAQDKQQLWVHIHLLQFALDILTSGNLKRSPCVLVEGQRRGMKVVSANVPASTLGVRAGMLLAAAEILGDLTVVMRNERAEQQALDRLCAWAYQFTPLISKADSDGLLLEVKGSLNLFGGIDGLLNTLRRGLREFGYKAVLAVAPTPAAATVLARAEQQKIIFSTQELTQALGPISLESLRLEHKQLEVLNSIGARTIGECLRLPRAGLGRRTAPKLLDIFQRLLGNAPDPRPRFELPSLFQSSLEIPWETTNAQATGLAGERLLHELVGYLRSRVAKTRHLRWSLNYTDGGVTHFQIDLTHPSRDHAHFAMLLREQLSRLKLSGKIGGLALYADDIIPDQEMRENDLFSSSPCTDAEDWPSFLDRLRARLGDQAVRGLKRVADHRPECAWRWSNVPTSAMTQANVVAKTEAGFNACSYSNSKQNVERPVWLMRRPIRLKAQQGSLDLNGPLHFLAERERIETGWWDGKPVGRDYFVAANPSGARLWIYRELSGNKEWYLHGIFE